MSPPKPRNIDTRIRPMKCAEAKTALRVLGFTHDKTVGSHEQWRRIHDGRLYKVTLACHRGEAQANDVRSMISQAGVSREAWYTAAAGYAMD